jgi:hypothetical protein
MNQWVNIEVCRRLRRERGFTLAEAVMAVMVLSIAVMGFITTISITQLQRANSRDRETMEDFLLHYVETLKGLDFASIQPGTPLNPLYDGAGGSPFITLPTNRVWVSVDTPDYQTFHPDLVWFTGRHPLLRLTLNITEQGGADYMKHVCLELKWDPPLNKGSQQTLRLDTVFAKDL